MCEISTVEYWENYLANLRHIRKTLEKKKWFKNGIGEVTQTLHQDEHQSICDEIERVILYVNLLKAIKRNNGFINVEPSVD